MGDKIQFKNVHGDFKVETGESYDITVVDVNTGEVTPIFEAQVIKETNEEIVVKDFGGVWSIKKSTIGHLELSIC